METTYANNELAIIDRVVVSDQPDLPPDVARGFLRLSFHDDDRRRMNELAENNTLGALTPEEQAELDSYERVGHLLSLLKSKARRSLQAAVPRS
ncbi:MAG: hypothetical protein NTY19_26925 [Planctomycetota bacterium]|nr:hypothetical protein [Planctomycetota bacterium]